ncbi:pentapeptide repeat-containing protein [Leptodesmis sp.]|uniref:pentapeptide repeat-containing protein n=1 Tax=Leptodesmis sp. TaxID=3100501 RepID=UPI0040535189
MAADPHSTPSSSSPDSPLPVHLRSSPERSGNSNGDQPAPLPPLAAENSDFSKVTQSPRSPLPDRAAGYAQLGHPREPDTQVTVPRVMILFVAIVVMSVGIVAGNFWIGIAGSIVALLISAQILWIPVRILLMDLIPEQERLILFGSLLGGLALLGFLKLTGAFERLGQFLGQIGWDAIGALGEVLGAVGQILIAILAVYVAWRQYIISRDLTIQQNLITQQQTIDSYFQGVSELVLDEEGLLEDWPQERAIAEGRTAAILSSVDASGKAKIIRFLSRARLLTPLKRDRRLGRAILDGAGGYEEDRVNGVRVIDLGVMLAGADLSGTDLRWTDLSEANLIRANLSYCDLVKANFSRTILFDAKLRYADLNSTRFFYGKATEASPRSRIEPPDYRTGKHTGAVIENTDFTGATQMSEEQRYYCCAWGGEQTRSTIPGGCEGIPNKLGR